VYRELYNGVADFCDQNDLRSVVNALDNIIQQNESENISEDILSDLFTKYNYAMAAKIITEKMLQYKF
jgi:hypothetical protein